MSVCLTPHADVLRWTCSLQVLMSDVDACMSMKTNHQTISQRQPLIRPTVRTANKMIGMIKHRCEETAKGQFHHHHHQDGWLLLLHFRVNFEPARTEYGPTYRQITHNRKTANTMLLVGCVAQWYRTPVFRRPTFPVLCSTCS